jgi:cytoskeletal protein RodZ
MPTIGEKLEKTRLHLGYSVEDVAHETRIHPNMIIHIEEDDFSQFPSVAYAKSFIRKYSEHLGVDLGDAMDTLNATGMRLDDNEVMGQMKSLIRKDRRFRLDRVANPHRRRLAHREASPLFLNLVLGTLLVSLSLFYFLGYNAPTAQQAKEDIVRRLGIEIPPAPPGVDNRSVEKSPTSIAPVVNDPSTASAGTPLLRPDDKPAVSVPFNDSLGPEAPESGIAGAPTKRSSTLPRPSAASDRILSDPTLAPAGAARFPADSAPPAVPQTAGKPLRAQPLPGSE